MESYQESRLTYVKIKMGYHLQYFFSIDKLNSNFEDGLNEGSLWLKRFSKHKYLVKINDINTR